MKKLTILLFILFCFSDCKYEKGPLITFKTKQDRVTGNWKIDEYFINGENKLSNLDTLKIDYYSFSMSRSSTDPRMEESHAGIEDGGYGDTLINNMYTYWGFSNNKDNLLLYPFYSYNSDSIGEFKGIPLLLFNENETESWTIVKLSDKKMWLRINVNNNEYEIHLYKIGDGD